MTARWRLAWILVACLCPATVALDLTSCNDGSTGCCMICPECACGGMCISCAVKCTQPKGCACSSTTSLTAAALSAPDAPLMSVPPDAGARE